MDVIRILLSAFFGTVLMTAFSYLVSAAFRKLYEEPILLSIIFRRLGMEGDSYPRVWGWLAHFLTGCLFATAFEWYWLRDGLSLQTAAIAGTVAGIAGILTWMIFVRIPDQRPPIGPSYYLQLFIAHLFFAAGAAAFSWWYGFPHEQINPY
ncbi:MULTISPECIES: hypothetical protein [unclassified Flavobacterium]|uniref:hypothetical protein n=1 Tax=unclassified Flavobacterium TaxID=196869 RepID=UPI001F146624|nr:MULTISPECIES: hypothetical protein [unclassified Flavobacterium]UMY65458.1 hypothetical protein MKO97_13245 [Flavobacterium sp. HJ-32-4]